MTRRSLVANLAAQLVTEGHDVRLIDRRPKARQMLSPGFPGAFHVGNGFSRAVLEAAGIVHADAFVAVTSGDNGNIVSARTAKDTYRVPIVLASIQDPHRADVCRELGIPTISSVRLTGRQVTEFDVDGEIRVVEITRAGRSLLPAHGVLAESGDLVTFSVTATALGRLGGFLDKELGT
ncbi:NAD-binding protein [Streptomyces cinerochromogenes]|uniref:NAD-binding protein n=1 Tax=Streptomyces cinerochromogenes TaxID=66422 RepID=UPI0016710C89|nr:NAD-binding protein [Streptomyces cinerochromogenes]GGS81062.1 hypothetical protein GCM10010206_49590 [Streptomyces cinerochromogenes]